MSANKIQSDWINSELLCDVGRDKQSSKDGKDGKEGKDDICALPDDGGWGR